MTETASVLAAAACPACGATVAPRTGACPRCGAPGLVPTESVDTGRIVAVTALAVPPDGFPEGHAIALVELDGGLRLVAAVDGAVPAVGDRGRVRSSDGRYTVRGVGRRRSTGTRGGGASGGRSAPAAL